MAGGMRRGPTDLPAGLYVDETLQITVSDGEGQGLQVSLTLGEAAAIAKELLARVAQWQAIAAATDERASLVLN